ncbi:MAG: hypothetical protein ACREM1_04535 [Longimicrobiales bacterium]
MLINHHADHKGSTDGVHARKLASFTRTTTNSAAPSAVVTLDNPGVWILGTPHDDDRHDGMGDPCMTLRCSWMSGLVRRFAVARTSLILLAFILPAARTAASSPTTNDSTDAKPAAMQTRLYFGMWSTHLRDLNHGMASNSMVGFAFRGFYGATFINSFGDRAVAGGLQRSFSPPRVGNITTWLGYRVGLITGYDERLFGIGDKLPVVPFAQFTAGIDVRNFGIELGYAGVVASVMMSYRF